jgi:hypothetical protein
MTAAASPAGSQFLRFFLKRKGRKEMDTRKVKGYQKKRKLR